MLIKTPETFITMPWKNGGGITHEILKHEEAGKLQWRLSMAEVASDGPFSIFAGLSRILTVFEGDGLTLHTPTDSLEARPHQPIAFSGDVPIDCTRKSNVVTDFNVIFDPTHCHAEVSIQPANHILNMTCALNQSHAALVLGNATLGSSSIPTRSLVYLETGSGQIECDGPIIHVTLNASQNV